MAGSAFDKTLAGFRDWAGTTGRKLSGGPDEVAGELAAVFDLMPDYLGIDSPARLNAGLLNDLLLHVYPRKVTVLDAEQAKDTVPAVRDLVTYLADTGKVTDTVARAMRRELDEIEPEFADAVMDPSNWGPATAMMHAMHRDGVEIGDQAVVDAWIARQNASGFAGAPGVFGGFPGLSGSAFSDPEDDPASWLGASLGDDFDIPDVVAPVRLPAEEVLAAQAAAAPLLADLLALAREVRDKAVAVDSVDPFLRELAVECELVDVDDDALLPGEDVEWLDDLGDDDPGDVLGVWNYAFGGILDTTLETANEIEPQVGGELDLSGHGIALVMDLFLGLRGGVPVAELSRNLKGAAVTELPPTAGEREWEEWAGAHGDPADLLLRQLMKLLAVTVTDGVARLEPLALQAIVAKLEDEGVHVPVIPPPAEMSPTDVVMLSAFAAEEDFTADLAAWAEARTPEKAARELVAFAADGDAAVRAGAINAASRLGEAAEPALREALERPELRCYVKMALIVRLGEEDAQQPVPDELKRTTEDLAWYLTDSFSVLARTISPNATFPLNVSELAAGGWDVASADALFDVMARLDHPDAETVLTMLGRHCDDKKTAKAARKAAHKAVSFAASRRG